MGTKESHHDSTWKVHQAMFRPRGVHMGIMQCDAELCTQCGLCIENCPFRAWAADENKIPRLREGYACFSCYNCMVACPTGAISIVNPYQVDKGGFYETLDGPLEPRMPLDPLDAEGRPDAWTTVEQTIFERRSVRNFKSKPVPEHLVRRVLEAGRFAPSSGNCQPWKFIVITDRTLIQQINTVCLPVFQMLYTTYIDDDAVKNLIPLYLQDPRPGSYDPRIVMGGIGSIAKQEAPMIPDAPVLILVACDDRSIGGPDIQAGICGQNMNLAAHSLGLGFCWIGFTRVIERIPELKRRLGLEKPWAIATSAVIGYPKFKQKGMVPREKRPVTWFRPGQKEPFIEP